MTDNTNKKIYDQKKIQMNQDYHKEYDKNGKNNKEKIKEWLKEIKKSKEQGI
ncbi:hypothetical protein [Inediibacterium massiliense]|uniref:hypothetical protein n=1 Tax=Inediibacterium massiliense TaxID=1658111 RepID=UPI0018FE2AAC|nr:hypothetical protein [Inediibacterium massiliense]